jgi:membrane-bound serine protease (ClpP class)
MNLPQALYGILSDPNVAYILFVAGIMGLLAEFYHPGTLLPGISGAVALVLAFVAFGTLPTNWGGVILILVAVGLFIAEAHTPGIGVLAAMGLVAFVLGSLLLFTPLTARSLAAPDLRVSPWLVGVATVGVATFFLFIVRAALRVRHLPVVTGRESLLGQEGVATTDLQPRGTVRIGGEDWSAISEPEPIKAGEVVEVIGVEGVTLHVRRPYSWSIPDLPELPSA